MNYEEIPETKNKIKVERITDDGKKEFVGFYDPEKAIHITSKREVAEFLIKEKGFKLVNVVKGENEKFYFVIVSQ